MKCDGACTVSIDRWQDAYKGRYLDMTVAVAKLFFRMIWTGSQKPSEVSWLPVLLLL
jgi:hypothetical protein